MKIRKTCILFCLLGLFVVSNSYSATLCRSIQFQEFTKESLDKINQELEINMFAELLTKKQAWVHLHEIMAKHNYENMSQFVSFLSKNFNELASLKSDFDLYQYGQSKLEQALQVVQSKKSYVGLQTLIFKAKSFDVVHNIANTKARESILEQSLKQYEETLLRGRPVAQEPQSSQVIYGPLRTDFKGARELMRDVQELKKWFRAQDSHVVGKLSNLKMLLLEEFQVTKFAELNSNIKSDPRAKMRVFAVFYNWLKEIGAVVYEDVDTRNPVADAFRALDGSLARIEKQASYDKDFHEFYKLAKFYGAFSKENMAQVKHDIFIAEAMQAKRDIKDARAQMVSSRNSNGQIDILLPVKLLENLWRKIKEDYPEISSAKNIKALIKSKDLSLFRDMEKEIKVMIDEAGYRFLDNELRFQELGEIYLLQAHKSSYLEAHKEDFASLVLLERAYQNYKAMSGLYLKKKH